MAEARDFHCHTHVIDNLGERSIPSDHVAVRVVIRKPLDCRGTVMRIPSWMSKHPVFCTILKQISDDHHYPNEPFGALADFKLIIEKARRRTRGSPSAKLLIAATAMRAYRNRHLGTFDALLRSMGASWAVFRPLLLSWVEPNHCQPYTGRHC